MISLVDLEILISRFLISRFLISRFLISRFLTQGANNFTETAHDLSAQVKTVRKERVELQVTSLIIIK